MKLPGNSPQYVRKTVPATPPSLPGTGHSTSPASSHWLEYMSLGADGSAGILGRHLHHLCAPASGLSTETQDTYDLTGQKKCKDKMKT